MFSKRVNSIIELEKAYCHMMGMVSIDLCTCMPVIVVDSIPFLRSTIITKLFFVHPEHSATLHVHYIDMLLEVHSNRLNLATIARPFPPNQPMEFTCELTISITRSSEPEAIICPSWLKLSVRTGQLKKRQNT